MKEGFQQLRDDLTLKITWGKSCNPTFCIATCVAWHVLFVTVHKKFSFSMAKQSNPLSEKKSHHKNTHHVFTVLRTSWLEVKSSLNVSVQYRASKVHHKKQEDKYRVSTLNKNVTEPTFMWITFILLLLVIQVHHGNLLIHHGCTLFVSVTSVSPVNMIPYSAVRSDGRSCRCRRRRSCR